MRLELFVLSHADHGLAYAVYSLFRKVLEGNLPVVRVQVHAVICQGISVCRQGVVGTRGIVAGTLAGVCAKEYRTGIHHLLGKGLVVACGDDEVFGSIGIAQRHCLVLVLNQYILRIAKRLLRHLRTRQQGKLLFYFVAYLLYHLLRCRDKYHLRVSAVLSL